MSEDERNIVLTGFMATGKSTVGRLLAEQLDRVFFDMDTAIEHRTGLTIPRIFADYSEPFFRAIERGLTHEIALVKNLVVATGGGVIIDDENRACLLKHTFVVCLMADPDAIETRLKATDARPLAGRWRELLEERRAIYETLPNIIDTTGKTPATVMQEINDLWQNA